MKSMTGYGFGEYQDEYVKLSIELKSYNNRFLDIFINVPSSMQGAEDMIRKYLSGRIFRGKIEFSLKIKELKENAVIKIDEEIAKRYMRAIEQLKTATGICDEIKISHLLRMEGVISRDLEPDPSLFERYVMPLLEKVYDEYDVYALNEGEATKVDIERHFRIIEKNVEMIEKRASSFEELIKKNLYQRFHQLLGDGADETRIYSETAVLLVKFSINEELIRLRSHLKSFKVLLDSDGPVGRRMDFICQELNREINTIGSKSMMVEIDQAVINLKDALENIREQIRNII